MLLAQTLVKIGVCYNHTMDKTAIEKKRDEKIAKLELKKQQIANRIARLRAIESVKARKLDTRRKILAGAWVLHRADQDPELHEGLLQGLDEFLIHSRDRALFALPPKVVSE